MPRDAVSRTANVERTGQHKWVNSQYSEYYIEIIDTIETYICAFLIHITMDKYYLQYFISLDNNLILVKRNLGTSIK